MHALTRDEILRTFATYGRPRESWLVGAEFERHLLKPDATPLTYFEPFGVKWMLETFEQRGWSLQYEGEHPIAALRDGASITLEPGCQFELSGSPRQRVVEVLDEATRFSKEVEAVLRQGSSGAHQILIGFTPFADIQQIPWVPKGRYEQMRNFLIKVGDLAHHMMKGTCAVQVSFDFLDEEDCARKMTLASQLAPLTVALFANSPISQGQRTGFHSYRGHIWTRTDPARTGVPNDRAFSYEGWIDYLLDVPMMFVKLDDRYVSGRDLTFRQWMDDGIDGRHPTWDDWDLHLTQVFPEVRAKKQIEVRGADAVPLPLAGAFCALWEGLFYCQATLRETLEIASDFSRCGTKEERFDVACRQGFQGEIAGRPMLDWAREVVGLAGRALDACAPWDRHLLFPLEDQLDRGVCPAQDLLDTFDADPRPAALIDRLRFRG
ncbi:MAG: glutamate--cysteine ligase [Deltaproteobacteria bacterium]|nr:MAG: glutamate--cysteine ligase [Deltaproteobacteria bacterium]